MSEIDYLTDLSYKFLKNQVFFIDYISSNISCKGIKKFIETVVESVKGTDKQYFIINYTNILLTEGLRTKSCKNGIDFRVLYNGITYDASASALEFPDGKMHYESYEE